jgi:hypothetical protein
MNNLLFTALLILLIYYFFYHLPHQKQLVSNPTLTPSQFTQTDPILIENEVSTKQSKEIDELKKDISQKEQTIIVLNNSYDKLEANSKNEIDNLKNQITNLQSQIRDLVKRPLKPTNSKGTQTENKDLENTLDTLIKDIQELNNSLC